MKHSNLIENYKEAVEEVISNESSSEKSSKFIKKRFLPSVEMTSLLVL